MLRKILIFLIFISFTFSTIGEFVKICFEETELVKDLVDSDDSEREDSGKEFELDKVFYDNPPFHFQQIFIASETFFAFSDLNSHYLQVIYTILSPPPDK